MGPGQLYNWALMEETWEQTRAKISASFPFHDFYLTKEGQPAHSRKVTAAAWGKGRAGTSPYLARATKKGHRVQLLHGTGALLPASAGTGLFLLHGISKAGWRAGHGGEVGKSWCVRQDFSRGLIAAEDRKQEGKGGRTGQKGEGEGKRERKSRKFLSEIAANLAPCAGSTGSPPSAGTSRLAQGHAVRAETQGRSSSCWHA